VYREDKIVVDFLASLPEHKTVVLDCVPTVENLTQIAYRILAPVIEQHFTRQIILERVRIYETPNCWAEVINQHK
jgi:6-pyruvoyltetrahydropterin/6-carboxytetrahydropterin synthase